jgi:UDP:flavonoid glycosyltransferase YjiC (YdhE family)
MIRAAQRSGSMRVLVVADGSRGDVQPMCVLASALAREGHTVTLSASPGMRGMVETAPLRFSPLLHDTEAMIRDLSSAVISGPSAVRRAAPVFFRAALESQMSVLPALAKDADFILAGGVHLGVPTVAERHGVPWRWVVYSVTMLPCAARPPMILPVARAPRWCNWLGWRYLEFYMNRHLLQPINDHRRRLGLAALSNLNDHLTCQNPILAIEPELAPLASEESGLDVIGHLDPGAGEALPAHVEEFLAKGPAPLYIGFGSMPDPAPAATTRLFEEACKLAGCRLLLSRGWAGFGAGLSAEHLAIDSVAHNRLFPRVAAVVHHGGAGTTAAATRAGVPQLVVPHLADQYHFGGLVEGLGIAVKSLRRTQLTAQKLAARFDRLLRDPELRARAAVVGETIRARPALTNASRLISIACERATLRPSTASMSAASP